MQDVRSQPSKPHAQPGPPENLTRNFGILLAGEVISKIIGIFVFGRLGRLLGDSRYGELEFAFATITITALIADAGLVVFGARSVARDRSSTSSLLPAFIVLRAGLVLLSLLVIGALALSGTGASPAILLASCLVLLPIPLVCDWVFQGRDEMWVITSSNVLRQSCLLVGVLLFVESPEHAWRVPVADAVGLVLTAALHQLLVRRRMAAPVWKGCMARSLAILREAAPIGLSTIAWAARFWAPMVFVGVCAESGFKGQYGAAHRLAVAMHQVVFLYYYNLLPTWSRLAADGSAGISNLLRAAVRRSFLMTLVLALGMILTTWWLSSDIIRILGYGPQFHQTDELLNVICLVPAIAWVSGNARFGLLAAGNPRGDMWANAAGAVFLVATLLVSTGSAATTVAPAFVAAEAVTGLVAWGWWYSKVRIAN